jgi:phosphonopyruvate decarboxylase
VSITPQEFYDTLGKIGINFYTGVPDSLLKHFCSYVSVFSEPNNNIITANEGNAIGLAAGYNLATGKLPLVYMQNSGLGNAVNPLVSLCDPDVYSIPMLLLIGWRGEPGVHDEPQHIKQGKIQNKLLRDIGIPFEVISADDHIWKQKVDFCANKALREQRPLALVVRKNTFEKYPIKKPSTLMGKMKREQALSVILDQIPAESIIVSTTGKTSREIFELREIKQQSHSGDFLTVGSMGHCSSIATGIAISKPDRKVICIDGDGALIMHMGALATVAKLKPNNFYHILINNQSHESVGGQETAAKHINISNLAHANYYNNVHSFNDIESMKAKFNLLISEMGPVFIEICVNVGSRNNLGRPTISPKDNKLNFMEYIKKGNS